MSEKEKRGLIYKHRFLIGRRITQISIIILYIGGNLYGWNILQGNLSSSKLFEVIPLADPFAVLQMFFAGAIVAADALIGALLILLFYSLIGGRAFCSWVCPVNMVTDFANWLRVKTGIHREEWQLRIPRKTRYIVLGMALILSAVLALPAFEFISPISILHRGLIFGMGMGWTMVLALFLFDLFVVKNGWCGHVCPLGGFYSLISKPSLIRVDYNYDRCTKCMECVKICPESQVLHMVSKQSALVSSGECINCGRCVEVCNDDAIYFSLRIKRKEAVSHEAK
jgi:ferredoxin-type protein NapH